MAPEAGRRIAMPDVVPMSEPIGLHLRKNRLTVDGLAIECDDVELMDAMMVAMAAIMASIRSQAIETPTREQADLSHLDRWLAVSFDRPDVDLRGGDSRVYPVADHRGRPLE
jgi:hypothetical protein